MRAMAIIAYDGSAFYGFQRQTSTPQTVTGQIEAALRQLQIDTKVVGSGRTDRGVHATGQVIHFDLPDYWHDLEKLRTILNGRLDAIVFRSLKKAPEGFHARFWAKRRRYRYLFKTGPKRLFERNYISFYPTGFDTVKLLQALTYFQGEHDFIHFHKTGSNPHSTVRHIYRSRYYYYKDIHIVTFEANGFLRSQVRMMVEAAMHYALGGLSENALLLQLNGEKKAIHTLAPAEGLYLSGIGYGPTFSNASFTSSTLLPS